MAYNYFILMVDERATVGDEEAFYGSLLLDLGMRSRHYIGSTLIFTSDDTPTIEMPGGGIAVGHIFRRDGTPIKESNQLAELADNGQLRDHVLDHCWGEYLLVLPSSDSESDLSVTRDPSGGVACVYYFRNGVGFITSDISLAISLELYEKQIDWDFIAYFLAYPNHKTRRTALVGLEELLPGCSLEASGRKGKAIPAWSPWTHVAAPSRANDADLAAHNIRDAIATVVAAWAKTDGSVLLELSGGLDSSVVATCLRDFRTQVVCCTMVTPVPGADERQYASLVSDHFGLPLHCEGLSFDSATIEFTPPSHSVVPCMTALQCATNSLMESVGDALRIESFFTGGGGDTVFCYMGSAAPAADAFVERGIVQGARAVRDLAELHQCTIWRAAWSTLRKLRKPPKAPCEADRSFLNLKRTSNDPEWHPWFVAPAGALHGDRERIASLAGTQVFRDGLPRGVRRRLRMPLLSQPVVEACLNVPSWMWIEGGVNRAVARSAFRELLPEDIVERRSKGSFVNFSGAVFDRNKPRIRDFLLSGHLRERDLLDTRALDLALGERVRSQEDSLQRILELCMVENWVRHQS